MSQKAQELAGHVKCNRRASAGLAELYHRPLTDSL